MDALLAAIVQDHRAKVNKLLRADVGLATCLVKQARLYQTAGILHWLYLGDTALHLAAAGYRVEIAGLLLTAGADANSAINHRKGRPLHYASDGYPSGPAWDPRRQAKTIRRLLDAGAEVNAQDSNGASALHRAVRTRSAAAAQLLLDSGADPTLKNKPGSTPFHLAVEDTGRGGSGSEEARTEQREIIRIFLSHGVRLKLRDGNGKTVFDRARSGWIKDMLLDTDRG